MDYYGRFILGGHSSDEWGMSISGAGTYSYPRRARELVSIPGRSGALIRDLGYYENVDISYNITILENFEQNIRAFMNFLQSQTGYIRLEDTYHPDVYRMVVSTKDVKVDAIKPDQGMSYKGGNFVLTLNCKPQAYLKEGEKVALTITEAGTYTWHNKYESYPLIRIKKTRLTDSCLVTMRPIKGDPFEDNARVTPRYNACFSTDSTSVENIATFDCEKKIIYGIEENTIFYGNQALTGIEYYLKNNYGTGTEILYGQALPAFRARDITVIVEGTPEKVEITPQWWMI